MSKELEKLSLKEKWDNFLDFVDAPTKARLLDCDCKEGLEQYRYLRTEIEDTIKELEVKREAIADILTGDDQKKLAAFDIIKKKNVNVSEVKSAIAFAIKNQVMMAIRKIEPYIYYNASRTNNERLTPEEFKLLKETLL